MQTGGIQEAVASSFHTVRPPSSVPFPLPRPVRATSQKHRGATPSSPAWGLRVIRGKITFQGAEGGVGQRCGSRPCHCPPPGLGWFSQLSVHHGSRRFCPQPWECQESPPNACSSAWYSPAEPRDTCLLICLILASWAARHLRTNLPDTRQCYYDFCCAIVLWLCYAIVNITKVIMFCILPLKNCW